jgi:hypothetical protein
VHAESSDKGGTAWEVLSEASHDGKEAGPHSGAQLRRHEDDADRRLSSAAFENAPLPVAASLPRPSSQYVFCTGSVCLADVQARWKTSQGRRSDMHPPARTRGERWMASVHFSRRSPAGDDCKGSSTRNILLNKTETTKTKLHAFNCQSQIAEKRTAGDTGATTETHTAFHVCSLQPTRLSPLIPAMCRREHRPRTYLL